jgi:excisionase family DNA binding protein
VDDQLLLSVPQMARRLAIGKTQAWAIVARGEIAVVKIGRSTRVVRQAVDDWATARASTRSVETDSLRGPREATSP